MRRTIEQLDQEIADAQDDMHDLILRVEQGTISADLAARALRATARRLADLCTCRALEIARRRGMGAAAPASSYSHLSGTPEKETDPASLQQQPRRPPARS